MTTKLITDYLDSNNIAYKVDENPSPAKVNRIQKALSRKRDLMNLAVSAYKQVRGA
ncbi:hypothetical protein SAMN04489796_101309 [Winogradskyella thalassocola]|uniref:Uncharacterized protein n=1 Tax=Winogradskyella thalassocola TaxID=262004 RepID=A0A1G7WBD6_9FLAO|nr:hypothetical protein SAMN04489796_101309 [Winogradskyella thalassocola]